MQLSVADLLLWHMKGASRLPCHYCRRAMWRSPDVNMGVSMLEWWKLSSSDRQEGLMFKLLLPWKQTLVLGGSSSYCGSECKWMLLVKGNDHFWYMCTDMMMLWSSVLLNWSDPWHSPSQKEWISLKTLVLLCCVLKTLSYDRQSSHALYLWQQH